MKKKSTSRLTLQLYWQHIRKRKLRFWSIALLTIAAVTIDQFIAPLLFATVFDKLGSTNSHTNLWQTFGALVAGYAFIKLVLNNVLWRTQVWLLWGLEIEVKRELAERSFAFLTDQSYRFHTNRFGGALVSQTTKFINAFERLFDEFAFSLLTLCTAFVATVVILAPRAPLYVAALLLVSAVYVTILQYRTRKQRPYNARHADAESKQTAQLADVIANIQTAKTFAHEGLEAKLFKKVTSTVAARDYDLRKLHTVNDTMFSSLNNSLAVVALVFGIYMITHNHAQIGTLYLMISYTANLLDRLWQLSGVMRQLNRGFGDAHDMTLMLQKEPDIQDAPGAATLHGGRGDITFRNVRFSYPELPDHALFKDFSLHIKPGEKVGLVGHSGSGKTTLTKLILRFMDIQDGEILIDQQNIAKVTQSSLRSSISYVSQEPIMFHRTIAENIRYGQLDATDKQVRATARLANAHEFIEQLPDGYDTLVGERGTKLSGGQRQRVAIARVMLKNAPILLLDEATSALDSESEALIQDALFKLMEGRTAIVIAHRLSTIQKMDRIIVLDHGRIVEQGSHKELIRAGGTYADLWNRQSGGFIDE